MIGDWFKNEVINQAILMGIVLLIVARLMYLPFFYPLLLLNTFFHEASHAIVTVMTGGQVKEFVVNPNRSGHIFSYGGSGILISNAGYLGAFIWGGFIYVFASRTPYDRWGLGLLGAALGLITFYFPAIDHAVYFGIGFAVVMVLAGILAPNWFCDLILRFIGMTCMISTFYSVLFGILLGVSQNSDAHNLAERHFGTPKLWAAFWLLTMIILFYIILRLSFKGQGGKKSNERAKS